MLVEAVLVQGNIGGVKELGVVIGKSRHGLVAVQNNDPEDLSRGTTSGNFTVSGFSNLAPHLVKISKIRDT